MKVQDQIKEYISTQPESKRKEIQTLHKLILQAAPKCKLWFSDGKNSAGKTVSNPNIGYGSYTIKYASGETKEFFRIGLSANTTGISVYIMGLKDKKDLAKKLGKKIGKAKVTSYCIKFKKLEDIDTKILHAAVRSRMLKGRAGF